MQSLGTGLFHLAQFPGDPSKSLCVSIIYSFYCWVILDGMDGPFACWRTSGLFPVWGYKHSYTSFCVNIPPAFRILSIIGVCLPSWVLPTEERGQKTSFSQLELGSSFWSITHNYVIFCSEVSCVRKQALQRIHFKTRIWEKKKRKKKPPRFSRGQPEWRFGCLSLQLVSSRDHISREVAMGSLLKVLWDGLGIVSVPWLPNPTLWSSWKCEL